MVLLNFACKGTTFNSNYKIIKSKIFFLFVIYALFAVKSELDTVVSSFRQKVARHTLGTCPFRSENVKIFPKNERLLCEKRGSFCTRDSEALFFTVFLSSCLSTACKTATQKVVVIVVRKEVLFDKFLRVLSVAGTCFENKRTVLR